MPSSNRRVPPVVRWLQVGAAAAGVGLGFAAAPAVAWADDSGTSAAADSAGTTGARAGGAETSAARPEHAEDMRGSTSGAGGGDVSEVAQSETVADGPRVRRSAGPARVSAQTTVSRGSDATAALDLSAPEAPEPMAATAPTAPAELAKSAPAAAQAAVPAAVTAPPAPAPLAKSAPARAEAAVPAVSSAVIDIDAQVAPTPAPQAKAAPQANATAATTASAAPGLGAFGSALRLNLEDLFTGTGAPKVTNPNAVVTGMFNQILRRDPTATELQNYVRDLNLFGVNAVVAGLYSSDAFRKNAVNNYYLELLGRTPTQQELNWGAIRLAFSSEPNYAASIAGSNEFYNASASGGGKFGTQPSATTYVNLLYRTMLGQAVPRNSVNPLVTQIQAGLPISFAANQFVNADTYRTVKVAEVYQVLGQEASPTDIAGYVRNWIWQGGQAGISQSLLATNANVQRIEAGLVTLPDMEAVAVLQKLLLAPYIDGPTGFNEQYKALVGDCSETAAPACKNPAAYALIRNGGSQRGIPNSSISTAGLAANIATLVPTQNEINLRSSLRFPLQNPKTLEDYFQGGIINHPNGPIITANDGTYIVDGHHRWSAIYLINPNTQIIANDLGYVPAPQDALRESQFGIVATTGVLTESTAGRPNVYDVERPVFDAFVRDTIAEGNEPDAVIAVFGKFISTEETWQTLSDAQKMTAIQDYMWNNVLRMRSNNPFIPKAPSRVVMPQFDPAVLILQNLAGGAVSYSFPTISYLG